VAFGLPYTRVGRESFQFVPLSGSVLLLVCGVLAAYFLAVEAVKAPFFRRFER